MNGYFKKRCFVNNCTRTQLIRLIKLVDLCKLKDQVRLNSNDASVKSAIPTSFVTASGNVNGIGTMPSLLVPLLQEKELNP